MVRYMRWTAEDMNKAVECVKKGTNVHKASVMFSVPTSTLRRRVLFGQPGRKGRKTVLSSGDETQLRNCICFMSRAGTPVTPQWIIDTAKRIASAR